MSEDGKRHPTTDVYGSPAFEAPKFSPPTQPAEDALNDGTPGPSHATLRLESTHTIARSTPHEPTPETRQLALDIPTQPAEDVYDEPKQANVLPASTLSHDFLLAKAREFLQSPNIRPESAERKRSFLLQKGLRPSDADALVNEIALPPPPVPPRSYPGAGKPTKLMAMVKTLTWFFGWCAASSTVALILYRALMLPRVSNVLAARHHLQARQVEQLERLGGELRVAVHKSAADEENNRSSQVEGSAPETYSADKTDKGKDLAERLQVLAASLESLQSVRRGNHSRSDTLQTVTHLTGFISSRVYGPPQFTQSGGTWNKRPVLGPAEEGVRAEIRALKGLALNRRSFTTPMSGKLTAGSKPPTAVIS